MPRSLKSSPSSASLVEAHLHRSRLLSAAVAAVHLTAVLPALILPLPLAARFGWLVCVLTALAWRLLRRPVRALRLLPNGRWRLSFPGREIDAELRSWYAHPWCCVALFGLGWRFRRAVVIPFWGVSADVHRRLRATLKASAPPDRRS